MANRNKIVNHHKSSLVQIQEWVDNRGLSPRIQDRVQMCKGFGVFGWEPRFDDFCIQIWDHHPSESTIDLLDSFSHEIGSNEAFFQLFDADFGGPAVAILSWTIEKGIEWIAGETLRHVLEKLRSPEAQEIALELKRQPEFQNEDGTIVIRISGTGLSPDDVRVTIDGYPSNFSGVRPDAIEELVSRIGNAPVPQYRYDSAGKFVEKESTNGWSIDA